MGNGTATVFFDIDGTLGWVDPAREDERPRWEQGLSPAPNDQVVGAVCALGHKGNRSFVCTGRPPGGIHPMISCMPFSGFVTLAGAYVTMGSRVLRNEPIPAELLDAVDRVLRKQGRGARLEGLQKVIEVRDGTDGRAVRSAASMAEALRQQPSGRAYKVILPTAAADAVMADPGLARELSASALELGNSELGLASNTKKAGIRAVLSALGPDAGTTYGFGDAENDLPLFAEVDVRVAMGNAVDALKARADYMTGSVHEDGVVSGLAHFGLI